MIHASNIKNFNALLIYNIRTLDEIYNKNSPSKDMYEEAEYHMREILYTLDKMSEYLPITPKILELGALHSVRKNGSCQYLFCKSVTHAPNRFQ